MEFRGVGAPELLLVFVVALIILGPERLPETADKVANFVRDFRAMTSAVTDQITQRPVPRRHRRPPLALGTNFHVHDN